ncbi:unnamed protein product [Effrenium voratum]|nr:unnamed protein product [Effrenium voratum]
MWSPREQQRLEAASLAYRRGSPRMPEERKSEKKSKKGQGRSRHQPDAAQEGWQRRQSHSALEETSLPPGPVATPAELGAAASAASEQARPEPEPAEPADAEEAEEAVVVPEVPEVTECAQEEAVSAVATLATQTEAEAVCAAVTAPAQAAPVEALKKQLEEEESTVAARWAELQKSARCRLQQGQEAFTVVQGKVKSLTGDKQLQAGVVGAGTGAVVLGTGGAISGLASGGLVGAAVGVVPAIFTFGLSIPFCAAIGGGAGLAVGAAGGATAGAVAGGATGYGAYGRRHQIREKASRTYEQVSTGADFVKTRANAATAFLSERATLARARILGGGTGGTEALD